MKKLIIMAFIAISSMSAFAQEGELDAKFMDYMVDTERRTVFVQAMDLDENDMKVFWEIYDKFEADLSVIRKRYADNINEFAKVYETLTDEQADRIALEAMKIKQDRLKLVKKYYEQMKKALGATTAARFIQVDDVISLVLELQVADQIPLMGDK